MKHAAPEATKALTTMRPRALFAGVLALSTVAGLAAACASDPPDLSIADGPAPVGSAGGPSVIPDPCVKTQACGDQCACGEGCCPDDGSVCVGSGARCWLPGQTCTTTADCVGADTYCNGGTCLPYLASTAKQQEDSCRVEADLPSLVPQVKCRWPGNTRPDVEPDSVQVAGTPMVIDFDFDGNKADVKPSIVFVSYTPPYSTTTDTGVLRVIDGETCELQHTIVDRFRIPADASPALANLDLESCPEDCPDERGDARPEIVFPVIDRTGASPRPHIVAYRYVDNRFVQWWDTETTTAVETLFSIAIDDLDGNGTPEVITADQVIDPNGRNRPGEVLFTIPFEGGRGLIEPPVIVDITGDRFPDVVTSQGIYVWDVLAGQLELGKFWPENNPSAITAAFTAVANLGDEAFDPLEGDQPEMVVVDATGAIAVMTINGQILHRSILPDGVGGPPTIADFDGDGRMEFASAGRSSFTVFDLDCRTGEKFNREGCNGARQGNSNAVLWTQRSLDTSSGRTGSSVFDFDDNGSSEIVYADECFLRIYDGKTGEVLQSVPRSSRTGFEYPVIADVDGDGHAEIVVGSNNNNPGFTCPATDPLKRETESEMTNGITVWGNDGWAGSRPIWNQYSYYVSHVRDDGTIPPGREVPRFWMTDEGTNSFRENTQGSLANSFSFNQADLTTVALPEVPCIRGNNGGFTARITLNMCNRGLQPIPASSAEVSLRDMANTSRPAMCTVRNGTELAGGTCQTLLCSVPATGTPMDIEIVGDPSDRVSECFEDNNSAQVLSVRCDDVTIQ